jgi:hypothetical protein
MYNVRLKRRADEESGRRTESAGEGMEGLGRGTGGLSGGEEARGLLEAQGRLGRDGLYGRGIRVWGKCTEGLTAESRITLTT